MGKAIEKTLSLGTHFQSNYPVEVLTGSVEVLDEFRVNEASDSEDEDEEKTLYQKRMVSYVELRIRIRRD